MTDEAGRVKVIGRVADHLHGCLTVLAMTGEHVGPLRVALDGPDAAAFAAELAASLGPTVTITAAEPPNMPCSDQPYDELLFAGPREACDANERATVLIEHDDPRRPRLRRIGGPAAATARLFSYGTLRLPAVQLATFGRLLEATEAQLPGYRQDWVRITDPDVIATSGADRHPIVRPSGDDSDAVAGAVFTITTAELAGADHYEVSDYRRQLLRLADGGYAWVYLDAATP